MRKLKRVLSFMLAAIMMISMSGMNVMAAEQQETREGYVEIALDNAASTYATNYYSKGLVVLNIATAGVSNECRITSGTRWLTADTLKCSAVAGNAPIIRKIFLII